MPKKLKCNFSHFFNLSELFRVIKKVQRTQNFEPSNNSYSKDISLEKVWHMDIEIKNFMLKRSFLGRLVFQFGWKAALKSRQI